MLFWILVLPGVLSYPTFTQQLFQFANKVAMEYYSHFKCLTFITDVENDASLLRVGGKPLVILNLRSGHLDCLGREKNCEDITNRVLRHAYEEGCKGFILRVQVQNRLQVVMNLLKIYRTTEKHRYNNHRYMILPVEEGDEGMEVLGWSEMYFFPNLILITAQRESFVNVHPSTLDVLKGLLRSERAEIKETPSSILPLRYNLTIWTHTFFNGEKWDVAHVHEEVVDTWSLARGYQLGANLFPNKMRDLQGKEVMLSLVDYLPYTTIISEGGKPVYDGLEVRIAVELILGINGTWDAKDEPEHLWGELYDNGTGNGILGAVYAHRADMGMGAIYQWFCSEVDCSYTYMQAEETCLVPRPQLLPGALTIVVPFTSLTWTALIITYIISSLFVCFLYIILDMKDAVPPDSFSFYLFTGFYNVLRLQLAQIPLAAHRQTIIGLYFKWVTLYFFVVAVCWSSSIASVLTVPRYEEPINEVKDLLARSPPLEWGANHPAWTFSLKNSDDAMIQRLTREFKVLPDETLSQRTKTRDFAFFVERLQYGHFGYNDYIDEESLKYLKAMRGIIVYGNCVMVLPRGSPYLENFDKTIMWMSATGLIHKWEMQVSLERVNNRLQTMIRTSNDKPVSMATDLQVRHIMGALYTLVVGLGLSLLVFCVEISLASPKGKNLDIDLKSFKRISN